MNRQTRTNRAAVDLEYSHSILNNQSSLLHEIMDILEAFLLINLAGRHSNHFKAWRVKTAKSRKKEAFNIHNKGLVVIQHLAWGTTWWDCDNYLATVFSSRPYISAFAAKLLLAYLRKSLYLHPRGMSNMYETVTLSLNAALIPWGHNSYLFSQNDDKFFNCWMLWLFGALPMLNGWKLQQTEEFWQEAERQSNPTLLMVYMFHAKAKMAYVGYPTIDEKLTHFTLLPKFNKHLVYPSNTLT